MICYLYPEPTYLLFSNAVPVLLYYAQMPATVIALLLSFYVFWNGKEFLLNRLLFLIAVLFSLWTFTTLIVWAGNDGGLMAFIWPFYNLILSFIAIFCVYFIYVFLTKNNVGTRLKIIFLALLAPILILAPTNFNVSGFNITNCDAFGFEPLPLKIYVALLGVLAMVWIFILLIKKYKTATPDFRKQIVLMGTGVELFLLSFFGMEFIATYLVRIGILHDSQLELYGLFGMVIFMIYVTILMVRFRAFNVKLIATQALVWGLVILIGSQFFFIKVFINIILTGVTFLASIIIGYFLIKSIKKEINQKEELVILNLDLQNLIQQRESLVHLITHKVKGSFTHTKYIFSEILDGSFGVISPELKRMAMLGLDSDDIGIRTVDLILNASNLQKGTVKYDFKSISLKGMVLKSIEDKKDVILSKGLEIEKNIGEEDYLVNGDAFWLKEVVSNLLDNAVNYTNKGKITVSLERKHSKILFIVKDTGIGITKEDMKNLFTEGGRGKEAVRTNVNSTGYGLYSVKLIVEAHKGRVWAESEGKGMGSELFVEFDGI